MPDRTDHPVPPLARGPWPEATDDRMFDHGASWCANAVGHPGPNDDYPDPQVHLPADECRTPARYVDARSGLAGATSDLAVYAARPFRFGERRSAVDPPPTRVVFEVYSEASDTEFRFSVSIGDALRVAMSLMAIVRGIDNA